MNYDNLPSYEGALVAKIADQNGVEPRALWDCYTEVMSNNFEQDLYDIMNENEDEIKERSKEYES